MKNFLLKNELTTLQGFPINKKIVYLRTKVFNERQTYRRKINRIFTKVDTKT
jgi:hypothetical protein